jgi:uncharacterized protein involved in oxidation of intracellular sulfur
LNASAGNEPSEKQDGNTMTRNLFILNDAPYGTERSYNGLRLINAISKQADEEVRVFLIGDAASCAKSGQVTPNGFYNVERMLKVSVRQNVKVGA